MAHASDAPVSRSAQPLPLAEFKPETIRGAQGFFRVGQTHAGRWWLIDAEDRGFFSRGVNGVGEGVAASLAAEADSFAPMPMAGGAAEEARATLARLGAWHVNTLGPGSAPELAGRGFARTENLELVKVAPPATIRLGGALVPDVFDPKWSEACQRQAAERCALGRESAELIGYFTDDALNWAQPAAVGEAARGGRPSLLQICLSLEPSFPAYHAAWEFALAAHGGEWAALVHAWDVALTNKEALRQLTLADTPLTGAGYRRDLEFFSREFARRYFAVSAAAIRRHDPHHLILGCRFGAAPAGPILAECVAPHVDVVSVNHGDAGLFERIDAAAGAQGMPVWLAEFSWSGADFAAPSRAGECGGLTSVERMLGRGRAELTRALAHPALVGCAWARWADTPDERAPFGGGLVHVDGSEAREHTELLSALYLRAETLRHAGPNLDPS